MDQFTVCIFFFLHFNQATSRMQNDLESYDLVFLVRIISMSDWFVEIYTTKNPYAGPQASTGLKVNTFKALHFRK